MFTMSPVRTIYSNPGFQPWVGFYASNMRAVSTQHSNCCGILAAHIPFEHISLRVRKLRVASQKHGFWPARTWFLDHKNIVLGR